MRNLAKCLPFIEPEIIDFFDIETPISKRAGLYIVGYRERGKWQCIYVGRASNLRQRTRSKHYANPDSSDRRLVELCRKIAKHREVNLFLYPMWNIEWWINHREAALIHRLKPTYNTREEKESRLWGPIDAVIECVEGIFQGSILAAIVLTALFLALVALRLAGLI